MPTDDQVRAAREDNEKLRAEIAEKRASNRAAAEDATNEYRLQRFAREREGLERELELLNEGEGVSIPQPLDETQVFPDTVQPDAQPEVSKDNPKPAPRPQTPPPSTEAVNPQGE